MNKIENLIDAAKLSDLLNKKEEKKTDVLVWILAIIGAVVAVAAIAYVVYRYFTPDYLDDFDDDFDDDLDDEEDDEDFFVDEGEN